MRGDDVEHYASVDEGWSPFMCGSSLLAADCRSLPEAYSNLGAWSLRWAALFRKERREIDLFLVLPVPVGAGDLVDLGTVPVRVCAACREGCSAAAPRWLAECNFAPVTPGSPCAIAPVTPRTWNPTAARLRRGRAHPQRPCLGTTPTKNSNAAGRPQRRSWSTSRSSTPCSD